MPLVSVTKDGRTIFVDSGSAHAQTLIDAGFKIDENADLHLTGGQGKIAPPVHPALPHPGNPASPYTSGNMKAAAKKHAEDVAFWEKRVHDKAATDAEQRQDEAALKSAKAKADADVAEANRVAAETRQKADAEAKANFDAQTAAANEKAAEDAAQKAKDDASKAKTDAKNSSK